MNEEHEHGKGRCCGGREGGCEDKKHGHHEREDGPGHGCGGKGHGHGHGHGHGRCCGGHHHAAEDN